jgi:hypothetical protein
MRLFTVVFLLVLLFLIPGHCSEDKNMNLPTMSIAWTKAPLREAKELGLRWVRLQIRWEALEPQKNNFNWLARDSFQVRNILGEVIREGADKLEVNQEPKYLF